MNQYTLVSDPGTPVLTYNIAEVATIDTSNWMNGTIIGVPSECSPNDTAASAPQLGIFTFYTNSHLTPVANVVINSASGNGQFVKTPNPGLLVFDFFDGPTDIQYPTRLDRSHFPKPFRISGLFGNLIYFGMPTPSFAGNLITFTITGVTTNSLCLISVVNGAGMVSANLQNCIENAIPTTGQIIITIPGPIIFDTVTFSVAVFNPT